MIRHIVLFSFPAELGAAERTALLGSASPRAQDRITQTARPLS
jgi:hypothetical protein